MKRRLSLPIAFFAAIAFLLGALFATAPTISASNVHALSKRITISLHRQRLRAWEGNKVVLSTPVTTGDPALPTPAGRFTVFAKFSPYEFISPWAYGTRYWYPPSRVSFAMEFIRGGYFIHDAPWRSVFGPGSNNGDAPGTNYGGSHGCVNVPSNAARFLYYWTPIGTPVHVVP